MKILNYERKEFEELSFVTEDLYSNLDLLKERLIACLNFEAPISEGLLERRVIQSLGMKKIGRIIQELLDDLVPSLNFKYTVYNGVKFYWRDSDNPEKCDLIRVTSLSENRRDAKDVPIEEARNSVRYIKENMPNLGENETIREAAKLMGYTRLGSIVLPLFIDAYNMEA
ncbi:MAG: hypothetical protein K6G38_05980 [Gammaproteobacteria bacterium]|nr:hypothetical protein [Gammaproteobacteria bacterium]